MYSRNEIQETLAALRADMAKQAKLTKEQRSTMIAQCVELIRACHVMRNMTFNPDLEQAEIDVFRNWIKRIIEQEERSISAIYEQGE